MVMGFSANTKVENSILVVTRIRRLQEVKHFGIKVGNPLTY